MGANSNRDDADATTWMSMLKKLSITAPYLMREGDDNASQDTAVPHISHEQPRHLKSPLPDPLVRKGKRRQCPSDPSPPKDAKRVCRPRGNRLRGRAKPSFLSLPVELRMVIFRLVLGDRKVHVHYKRGLYSDPQAEMSKMAFVQYLPQYVFCHHDAFMEDPPLRRAVASIKGYDNHHDLCNLPCVSLEKKLGSALQDTSTRLGQPHGGLLNIPSPKSIKLMYESFELRLSIFGVSSQIREEAMEAYYKTNTFSFATATFFNMFLSRITDKKASLLRKVEFIYDLADFCSSRDEERTSPARWRFGAENTDVLIKLANITEVTIRYCNLYSITRREIWRDSKIEEIAQLDERLRRDFGGLARLQSITKVDIQAYDGSSSRSGGVGRKSRSLLDKASASSQSDSGTEPTDKQLS